MPGNALRKAGTKVASKVGDLISDWKWRPNSEVRQILGEPTEVPAYVTDTYGAFMADQAQKASRNALSPRDAAKAYAITRSSVNRGARTVDDDLASGNARPEGYFSEWLLSPTGRKFLNDAERGRVNEDAISDITRRFQPFGMADTLGNDLRYIASNPVDPNALSRAVTGSPEEWRAFAQSMPGIGPAKSGFMASMLGRGDMPTLDARQLVLQTGESAKNASKYMRRGGGVGGDQAVDRLAQRQTELGLSLPKELAPQYQHLTHHTIWDLIGGTQTTHDDLVRAMQRGFITPKQAAILATGAGAGVAGYKAFTGDDKAAQKAKGAIEQRNALMKKAIDGDQ